MEEGKYAKILAKIQVGAIFRLWDIRRNVLPKSIELYENAMLVPLWGAPTWRPGTNRNISYQVVLLKRDFIPRWIHKIKVNTFPKDC